MTFYPSSLCTYLIDVADKLDALLFYPGTPWADNNEIYYRDKIHAPLADLADRIEVLDYEEPPDALSDTSEEYALVHDALPAGRIQRVHSTLKRELKPGA